MDRFLNSGLSFLSIKKKETRKTMGLLLFSENLDIAGCMSEPGSLHFKYEVL